ncbi:UvsX [Aeromonas phage Aeh1]|uniref:UvsX n=1 Tax=Aeromonas phage Aeh1 TaxID=2880362 RepID=Q76Z75_9CAUD|nr:DNA repair protein [Aeromonas phage Aeh1]AAQ17671.1 UvsX [Aeromonas phage Aeh1]
MAKGIKTAKTGNLGSLMSKLAGTSSNKMSSVLADSKFFNDKDCVRTRVPLLNLAMSGELDGGLTPGLTVLAGPSKHFKSNLSLVFVAAYLRKYPDAVCIFFDNEFGSTPGYFESQGVDISRVIHCPFKNIEELKFDIVKKLEAIERGDRVIVFVDSIGNAASKKEIDDAIDEKSVSDMTRAKQIKSLTRMMTPYLTVNDIPAIMVAHTYDTQEMYSKKVVSGGTGITYSSDTVIIIGRQQEKDGKELLGYNFVLNMEKSRFVKEQSKLPLEVTFQGGINTYSGMLDIALEVGFVVKPSNGWFSRAFLDEETGELVEEDRKWRRADTNCLEFWKPMFAHQPFKTACSDMFKLKSVAVKDEVFDEVDELFSGEAEMPVNMGRKLDTADQEEIDQLEEVDVEGSDSDELFANLD